jgi:hypothetical protein
MEFAVEGICKRLTDRGIKKAAAKPEPLREDNKGEPIFLARKRRAIRRLGHRID